jgi:hypothetical protein
VHLVTRPAISAVAFCPHPPLLLPGIAAGAEIETESLRFACRQALDRLIGSGAGRIAIVGADGPLVNLHSFAPGLPDLGHRPLPLSLLVGEWLLSAHDQRPAAIHVPIGPDATATWPDLAGPTALLVMGDGTARRSLKGPGYLDERAEVFDDAVVAALGKVAPQQLADLDLTLAAELLAAGAPAWVATGRLVGDRPWHGEVLYADAPYGVMYTVATWLA